MTPTPAPERPKPTKSRSLHLSLSPDLKDASDPDAGVGPCPSGYVSSLFARIPLRESGRSGTRTPGRTRSTRSDEHWVGTLTSSVVRRREERSRFAAPRWFCRNSHTRGVIERRRVIEEAAIHTPDGRRTPRRVRDVAGLLLLDRLSVRTRPPPGSPQSAPGHRPAGRPGCGR